MSSARASDEDAVSAGHGRLLEALSTFLPISASKQTFRSLVRPLPARRSQHVEEVMPGHSAMARLIADVRYAVRVITRTPSFAVAIVTPLCSCSTHAARRSGVNGSSGALWPESNYVQALTITRLELHHLREDGDD